MFKNIQISASLFLLVLMVPPQACAHPSGHATLNTSALIQHWLSSPLHLGLTLMAALVLIIVTGKMLIPSTKNGSNK